MKTSYKYLLGIVAVIGTVMLYKKYGKKEVVAPSKAKSASTESAPVADDENSEFLGFKPKKKVKANTNWASAESGKCPKGYSPASDGWCYKKGNVAV